MDDDDPWELYEKLPFGNPPRRRTVNERVNPKLVNDSSVDEWGLPSADPLPSKLNYGVEDESEAMQRLKQALRDAKRRGLMS